MLECSQIGELLQCKTYLVLWQSGGEEGGKGGGLAAPAVAVAGHSGYSAPVRKMFQGS